MITDILMRRPGLGLIELGDLTGLHDNTLRDHLKVLSGEGVVRSETERRAGRGRPRLVYFAVDALTENEIAQNRIDEAKRRGDLLRRVMPGPPVDLDDDAVHQLDALYEHLDAVGLDPELDDANLRVQLTPCPFHKLIDEHPETICNVHEGLVRDVLLRAGGPVEVDRLMPLVTPHACILRLRLASGE
jgi:predicted ArsR family transcriptional regulator